VIEVDNVTKRYGSATVVDSVSLTIAKGGMTAIVGPNGAGKSTLCSMIGRLIPMDEGSIKVDGFDVTATKGERLARRISILSQENHVTARLSVEDLVLLGRYPYTHGRTTIEDREHLEATIDFMELGPLRHRFLDQLSGGQRQRAFVAMVLCQDTDYILLDEPLNSLDMKHAVAMMKLLRRVCDEQQKTIVYVVHDVNIASWYSDRVVALKDGRIVHDGDPSSFMQPEVMESIFEVDVVIQEVKGKPFAVYYG
jgi:iron complex transport system ATP-binding protein